MAGSAAKLPASVFLQSLRATYAQHMAAGRQVRENPGCGAGGSEKLCASSETARDFPKCTVGRRFRAQLRAKMEFFVSNRSRKVMLQCARRRDTG
jgi:hypothetical protein